MSKDSKKGLIKDGFELNSINSLFKITVIFVVLSPFAVYLIAFVISRWMPSEFLYHARVGNIPTWIGFAGSILGGSMTMFAVLYTLFYESIMKKKERALDAMPIVALEPVFSNNRSGIIVNGNEELWLRLAIKNTSNNHAHKVKISLIAFIPSGEESFKSIDVKDDSHIMNGDINILPSNTSNDFYLKIASQELDKKYPQIFSESKIYVTYNLRIELTDIYNLETRFFKATLNGYLIHNDVEYSDVHDESGEIIGEDYDKYNFRILTYYTELV